MKKILALVSFLSVLAACTTQPSTNTNTASNTNSATAKSAAPSADEMFAKEADEMFAKEKAAWDTLKQKDYDAFGNMLASDYIEVTDEGVFDKAGIIAVVKDFVPTDITFSDWKMLPIDNDAVILTYKLTLKGLEKGKEIQPGPQHAAAVWVNRDGKWLAFCFQQTPAKDTPPPPPANTSKAEKTAASPAAKAPETGPKLGESGLSPDPIANEKIVWDFFKSKNLDAFAAVLDPAFVEIESNMVMDKATAVKGADFDTSQLELSEWKSAKLDNDAALVTYLVTPKDPKMNQERHTTIWANRGGKWVALLHIGTPVMKPMAPSEMKKM